MPDIFTQHHNTPQEKVPLHEKPEKEQRMGLFASFCEYPTNVDFVNQEKDEKIILFIRRHFITNLSWIAPSIAALFVPPLFGIVSTFFPIDFFPVPPGVLTVMVIFYYLIVVGYAFTSFLSWFFNIGIVTDKRLVDIDYHNILHKNIATTHFQEVVDLEFTQKGLFQSYFNYGDIMLQTQGIKPNFEFLAAPKPILISNVIHEILAKVRGVKK